METYRTLNNASFDFVNHGESVMKNIKRIPKASLIAILLTLAGSTLVLTAAHGYIAADFNWRPVFTTSINEIPSVTLIIDSSDSMHRMAYAINSEQGSYKWNGEPFNTTAPDERYYGYFNSSQRYTYKNRNSTDGGYFLETGDSGEWSGKFLNWATMHRGDVLKKILTGGVYNSTHQWFEILTTNNVEKIIEWDDSIYEYTPFNSSLKIYQQINTNDLYISDNKNKPLDGPLKLRVKPATPPINATEVTGVLDKFKNKARFALFKFIDAGSPSNQHAGGELLVPMGNNTIELIKDEIRDIQPTGQSTPLAETLYSVTGYIQQIPPKDSIYESTKDNTGRYNGDYPVNSTADPFYFPEARNGTGELIYCTQQNVVLLTGGESTFDEYIPNSIKSAYPEINQNKAPYKALIDAKGSTYLLNVGYWAHTSDLRSDLPAKQNINLYTVFTFGRASHLLKHASIYAGFMDKDKDGKPTTDPLTYLSSDTTPESDEYNTNADQYPDNYFEAFTGDALEVAITNALDLATRSLMSGTAAAVTAQTRSGEGAVYQALFFPPNLSTQIAPAWSGQIHALLVDSLGNMREDTNGNKKLDSSDFIVKFEDVTDSVNINRYYINGTRVNPYLNTTIDDINFIWSTTDWLNDANILPLEQRTYNSPEYKRYIFTYAAGSINSGQTMIPSTSEIQPFTTDYCDPQSPTSFCRYLTPYETSSGIVGIHSNASYRDDSIITEFAKRQVKFIRGEDLISPFNYSGKTYYDKTRSRKYNNDALTWRLGDIVHSSPTIVGAPAENYDTLYGDITYKEFRSKYKNRRQMIYAGANDGMLHAFNGGFYNSSSAGFELGAGTQYPLGMEMWAYIPYNLLPHLRWLMNPDYGDRYHASYVDLKPRIFDARIFTDTAKYSNSTYPNGWGTVLVAGMRFGGATINAADRTMRSAYVIMDITDPEQPPKLLGEITMPKLGFTTCYPTVMPMSTPNTQGTTNYTTTDNQWYLVFGSGPADFEGSPSRILLESYRATENATVSMQAAELYILDLNALAQGTVLTADNSGNFNTSNATFQIAENYSYIGDPISVDLDVGSTNDSVAFKTDIVYYGTTSGLNSAPRGTMRRVTTDNNLRSGVKAAWSNSTLINLDIPITAAPSVAIDETKQLWVYFGTGRFFNRGDMPQDLNMSFFGLKEPMTDNATQDKYTYSWADIDPIFIFDSTNVNISNSTCGSTFTKSCVSITKTETNGTVISYGTTDGTTPWDALVSEATSYKGWRHNFSWNMERVLGQPAILGGAVIFTTYAPGIDVCSFEGDSRLYAVYYKTGTSFYEPILTSSGDIFSKFVGLGKGMATSPNLHVGEGEGSNAFIQTSTGAIQSIKIENPLSIKSGTLFWRKNTN